MATPVAAIYHIPGHKRSMLIAEAMAHGMRRLGMPYRLIPTDQFKDVVAEIAVFYGFDDKLREIFRTYREAGKTVVYIDLGYFGRLEGGKWGGYHKVSVNARHPTDYFQVKQHDDRRVSRFALDFKPWKPGKHILVCGTSDKGAIVDGFEPQGWETATIKALNRVTQRPIIYRPKPSWAGSSPIPGSIFARSKEDVAGWLKDAHAVISHHSNVCVDAFLAGVPNFCVEGVGLPLSESDFTKIETPLTPPGRRQWAMNLAYCQYSVKEMAEGVAWRSLKDEGLI